MATSTDTPWAGEQFSPPTALDIETLESAIVARLASIVTAVEVVHFPDDPKSYRLTHRVGAALVTYRGATYGDVLDSAATIQERRLEFDVALLMRDLGWGVGSAPDGSSPGAYAILEQVRAALTGYRIPGARKMRPVREKFLERDRRGGLWIYSTTFALSTVAVEPSSANDFPLFVKGIALDSGGNTTVTVGATPYTFDSQDQIQLPHGNVLAATVSAVSTGNPYVEGVDYTLGAPAGLITRLTGGAIPAGATVDVAYSYAETAVASAGQTAPSAP